MFGGVLKRVKKNLKSEAGVEDLPIYDFGDDGSAGCTYRIDCSGKIVFLAGGITNDNVGTLKCYGWLDNKNTFSPVFGVVIHNKKQARQLQNLFEDIEDSFNLMEDVADDDEQQKNLLRT